MIKICYFYGPKQVFYWPNYVTRRTGKNVLSEAQVMSTCWQVLPVQVKLKVRQLKINLTLSYFKTDVISGSS